MFSGAAPGNQNVLGITRGAAGLRLFWYGAREAGKRIKRPSRIRVFFVLVPNLLRHLVGYRGERRNCGSILRLFQRLAHLLPH